MAILADVHFKTEPSVKAQSEVYLKSMGISLSDYLNMSLRQLNNKKRIPFDVEVPSESMHVETKEELQAFLEQIVDNEAPDDECYTMSDLEKHFGLENATAVS